MPQCSIADCTDATKARGWCNRHYHRWRRFGDPTHVDQVRGTPSERFWRKVQKTAACWEWRAFRDQDGYGVFGVRTGLSVRAHRFAYEDLVGPIPDGLVIDHLCRNRACVNPAHLEPVENRTNILRGVGSPAQNARREFCVNGHPLAGDNLYPQPDGKRMCKECRRQRKRARLEAEKEQRRSEGRILNAAKTHCIKGHPFAGENLRITPSGKRICRECERYWARQAYHRKRAAALP